MVSDSPPSGRRRVLDTFVLTPSYTPTNGNSNMSHMKPGGRTVVRPYNVGGGCKQSRLHIKCRDAPRCVRTYIHEYRQEHTDGRTAVRPYRVGKGCTQSRLHIKCRDAPRCVRTYIHEYRQEHTGGRTAVRPYKKVRRQNRTPSVSSTWLRVLVTLVTSGVS